MTFDNQEDFEFYYKKVLVWLDRSEKYVSAEMIARYSALPLDFVRQVFDDLEKKYIIAYSNTSGPRVIYKVDKRMVSCWLKECELDLTF